ncbi:MAG: hypothetical protein ACI4MC_06870 [Candidatus Coproplasma sp.]
MKSKIKKLSILGLAISAVITGSCLFGACSEKAPDYTTYTYADWSAMEDADWDAKTISYQFIVDASARTSEVLINLYSDGTALVWQVGLYNTEGLDDAHWADEDRQIAWDFYGLWQENANQSLKIHYFGDMVENVETVTASMDENWQKNESGSMIKHCFQVTANYDATSGNYLLESGCGLNTYFANNGGVNFPEAFSVACSATTGSAIKYNTLQSYVNSYIGNKANFPQY